MVKKLVIVCIIAGIAISKLAVYSSDLLDKYEALMEEYNETLDYLHSLEDSYNALFNENQKLKDKFYTKEEIMHYVNYEDNTDKLPYIPGVFECGEFSKALVANLRYHFPGIDARVVVVDANNDTQVDHAIVGIFWKDGDVLFIEPQEDKDVTTYYDRDKDGKIEYVKEDGENVIVDLQRDKLVWADWFYPNLFTDDGLIVVDCDGM